MEALPDEGLPRGGASRSASSNFCVTEVDLEVATGRKRGDRSLLRVTIRQESQYKNHGLGRFRIATTTSSAARLSRSNARSLCAASKCESTRAIPRPHEAGKAGWREIQLLGPR